MNRRSRPGGSDDPGPPGLQPTQVLVRYLGSRVGKFMVMPARGGKQYFFCRSQPEVQMSLREANALVAQSAAEFVIVVREEQQPKPEPELFRLEPEEEAIQSKPPPIAAKFGRKAHRPLCQSYPRFPDRVFETPEEALAAGFELCQRIACFRNYKEGP